MIDKGSMLAPMAALDPRLAAVHRAWQKEWADDLDPPVYACLSDFAHVVVEAVAGGDLRLCTEAFAVVERWLLAGDDGVRQAAIAGFLEDLQNIGLHEGPW